MCCYAILFTSQLACHEGALSKCELNLSWASMGHHGFLETVCLMLPSPLLSSPLLSSPPLSSPLLSSPLLSSPLPSPPLLSYPLLASLSLCSIMYSNS